MSTHPPISPGRGDEEVDLAGEVTLRDEPQPSAFDSLLRQVARAPVDADTPLVGELAPGVTVADRFELVREIGRGGFARVFEARDRVLSRPVAIKLLKRRRRLNDSELELFYREARATARLNHPHIVTAYDWGAWNDTPFLVLELLDGESLEKQVARGPLGEERAWEIVTEVAQALAYAHSLGVLHLDLKSQNVFVLRDGRVKVLDFGLAGLDWDEEIPGRLVRIGGGTPRTMAPEQAEGAATDARTDVWAVGVMLHHLLFGRLPETLAPEAKGVSLPAGTSRRAEQLLARTLSRDPEERYRDAPALLAALAEAGGPPDAGRRADRAALTEATQRWNVPHAAARLGMAPNTLRYRMKKHGLQPEAGSTRAEYAPEIPPAVRTPQPPLRWEQRHLALLRVSMTASGGALSATTSSALEAVVDKVQSFGGYLEDLVPDAVVAVFGREPAEDAARRAAHAALAIQRMVKRARAERNQPWVTTTAIHAGPFLVGEIGGMRTIEADAKRAALAILEDAVRRGSADTIVVTAEAMRFLERRFELAPLGQTQTGASVWRLDGRNAGVTAARLTPFIGRESELRFVLHRLALAKEGRGQVVGIVADAGIGKSRLLLEFQRAHETAAVPFLEGRCYSYTTAQPYVPLLEIIRQACGIGDADDYARATGAVRAALERVGGTPGRDAVHLLHLLGYREASEQLVGFASAALKTRTVEALRLLCFGTDKQPVILAVEDLHWIDRASEEFLQALIEQVPAVSAAIVLTYRPGYRPPWADRSYATQIALPPLSGSESRGVLEATLGQAGVPETVAEEILRRAEGNPFFLEEMARAVGSDVQGTGTIEVPSTIQSVLRARLDRLEPEVRGLIQCAAVIGKDVQLSLLQAVADHSDNALERGLDELQAAEFLYRTRAFPDLEYTFKHALTHEVAYGSLLDDRRRALHRRIVETLERLSADPSSADVERLAHHAVHGEIWEKAVAYLRQAGTKALLRSANAEAIAYLTRGLDVAGKLPATREHMRQEMELLLALGQALQAAKGFAAAEAEKAYSRARELGERTGEAGDLFRALWGLWLYTNGSGRTEGAHRIAQQLLAVAERQDDPALLLEGHHPMWASTLWRGDLGAARRHIEHGMALYNRDQHRSHAVLYGGHDPGVCCRMMSGLNLWLLGHPTSALEKIDAAVSLARELSHPYSLVIALGWAGFVHQLRRDVEATRKVAESMIALSVEHGFQQWLSAGKVLDGWGLAEQGRGDEATAHIRSSIAEYRATGTELFAPYLLSVLAATHLKHGDPEEGLSAAVQGLELATVTGEQVWSAELSRLKGELVLACNPSHESEAEEAFRQAIEIARRQAAGSWELRAVTSLARLLARQGALDAARGMLADAYGRITEGFDTPDLREAKILLDEWHLPSVAPR